MNSETLWCLFWDTGDPIAYLLYAEAERAEPEGEMRPSA